MTENLFFLVQGAQLGTGQCPEESIVTNCINLTVRSPASRVSPYTLT